LSLEELGEYCIYVEARNEDGARERFWISCATGLLVKYEAEEDGNVTYSMLQTFIESPVTSDEAFASAFTLPGGRSAA
jgi:hypothetical protein